MISTMILMLLYGLNNVSHDLNIPQSFEFITLYKVKTIYHTYEMTLTMTFLFKVYQDDP